MIDISITSCVHYIFYRISSKTNRAPFDLAEAESELVSGFMTEHAAVIFVFFFLAEYASIVLICISIKCNTILRRLLIDYTQILYILNEVLFNLDFAVNSPLIEGMLFGLTIGVKSWLMIFIFIWVRASFPRIRFDQLMSFSWTILLPVVIALIVFIPCVIYSFEIIPSNITLF